MSAMRPGSSAARACSSLCLRTGICGWLPTTVKIKLVSSVDTGFFYVTKKNPRTKTEKLSFNKYDPVAHVEFVGAKISTRVARFRAAGVTDVAPIRRSRGFGPAVASRASGSSCSPENGQPGDPDRGARQQRAQSYPAPNRARLIGFDIGRGARRADAFLVVALALAEIPLSPGYYCVQPLVGLGDDQTRARDYRHWIVHRRP